ncbi:MAG: DNA-binding protein HU 1 [Ignavibacteria bacterium ADurb.Bin266]|nr:MAG: DNA-binding protein HU 1 [Ignavibacteria bacterium ADurb.Bin266]
MLSLGGLIFPNFFHINKNNHARYPTRLFTISLKHEIIMNKSDLILKLSEKHNLTEKTTTHIIDAVFDGFIQALKNEGRIEIRGFGSICVRQYGAYTGRNPKTGTTVDIKAKKSPFFKAGKELKKMVDY